MFLLVKVKLPEEYKDVHQELAFADFTNNPTAFETELVKTEAGAQIYMTKEQFDELIERSLDLAEFHHDDIRSLANNAKLIGD